MSMHLTVEAHVAPVFSIEATGRDAALCGALENNLILDIYRDVVGAAGKDATPLRLRIHNEIPLGMGCGSSAAAIVAGVMLADHFGDIGMTARQIVEAASEAEGHPDNVAACYFGGFTASTEGLDGVETATFEGNPGWHMMLAVQASSLATKKARALLPDSYSKADAIFNVQRVSLLVAAFAQGRLELLKTAMQDRMHQPFRTGACPLLDRLLPLAEEAEIAGVALSGAGPSVLVFLAEETTVIEAETRMRELVGVDVEILALRIGSGAERTVL
jgi:homoserine kinase